MPKLPRRDSDRRSHHGKGPQATLRSGPHKLTTPTLGDVDGGWHPATVEWWSDQVTGLWASPMGAELVDADIHGLRRLALLVDAFHTAANIRDRLALASEIRLEGAAFGLDPQSRRRLGWVVVAPKADSVVERYLRREPDSDARDHLRR